MIVMDSKVVWRVSLIDKLLEGEIGDWRVYDMVGTSITQKEALYDIKDKLNLIMDSDIS